MSPHLLMLGQESQLTVDFILGRVWEPVLGQVCDWVQEHEAHLQILFNGAWEHLSAAAARRKKRHDQQVRDLPLIECQLVYVRNLGWWGHNKIQDSWSWVVHTVLRAPREGVAVYTMAPTTNPHKVRHVHHCMAWKALLIVHPLPPVLMCLCPWTTRAPVMRSFGWPST